jgi:hypothetical protein
MGISCEALKHGSVLRGDVPCAPRYITPKICFNKCGARDFGWSVMPRSQGGRGQSKLRTPNTP